MGAFMKFTILLSILIASPFSFAEEIASNIMSLPEEICQDSNLDGVGKKTSNLITYEKIVKVKAGTYWVKNIHLKSDGEFYRIKENMINRSRICKDLGFRKQAPAGTTLEFDKKETVVGISKKFKIIDWKRDEAYFIKNLTCIK
jgi:hypothetical protein